MGMKAKSLAAPHIVWTIVFTVIPLFLLLYYSATIEADGRTAFTFDNFLRAFDADYINVIMDSLRLALISTAVCLILGYPAAYILARSESAGMTSLLFLFVLPMWMNFLLRTYGWLTILENNGLINTLLRLAGLAPLNLLNNEFAVLLGMVYNYLPFMILPVFTSLKKIDKSLVEAAQDLGADNVKTFARLIFPLSVPGVISGVTMVFMPAVTTFVISSLLGGGKTILIGNLIENQFLTIGDKNFGSALSIILMAIILLSMGVISIADKNGDGGVLI
jgi:spermidine/putrescine transport system permease protein